MVAHYDRSFPDPCGWGRQNYECPASSQTHGPAAILVFRIFMKK